MEKKQNDRKELRTSFDMVTFATAIETLRKGEETIASLAERYEEVIGSDFVECAINVIKQR